MEKTAKEDVLSAPPIAPNGLSDAANVEPKANGDHGHKRKRDDGETPEEKAERRRRKKEKKEKKATNKAGKGAKASESEGSD